MRDRKTKKDRKKEKDYNYEMVLRERKDEES